MLQLLPIYYLSSDVLICRYNTWIAVRVEDQQKHCTSFNLVSTRPEVRAGSAIQQHITDLCLDLLTVLDSFPVKSQVTEFLEMSELGLYQAWNTTIWPLTTSSSPLGISTFCVSPGTTTQTSTETVYQDCSVTEEQQSLFSRFGADWSHNGDHL